MSQTKICVDMQTDKKTDTLSPQKTVGPLALSGSASYDIDPMWCQIGSAEKKVPTIIIIIVIGS